MNCFWHFPGSHETAKTIWLSFYCHLTAPWLAIMAHFHHASLVVTRSGYISAHLYSQIYSKKCNFCFGSRSLNFRNCVCYLYSKCSGDQALNNGSMRCCIRVTFQAFNYRQSWGLRWFFWCLLRRYTYVFLRGHVFLGMFLNFVREFMQKAVFDRPHLETKKFDVRRKNRSNPICT